MRNLKQFTIGLMTLGLLFAQAAYASTASISIESLSPGATAPTGVTLTFIVVPTGFTPQTYQVSDSFTGSSIGFNNINSSGNFSWLPRVSDVGTHVLTITALDYLGGTATATQTITVPPPPSIAIQSVSPGSTVMPGSKFTFTIVPNGFVSPSYIVGDSVGGSGVKNEDIDASGNFSWTPDVAQNGLHTITVYANDSQGHNASANVSVQVGAGPSLSVLSIAPGTSVSPGQAVTFTVIGNNFSPTAFTLLDSFSGVSSISNANISNAGAFSWAPQTGDVGVHALTVTGTVGAYGASATTTQTLTVLGPNGAIPAATSTSTVTSTSASSTATAATSTTITAVDALKAQIALLNAQIAARAAATSSTSATSGAVFTAHLSQGMEGDEVTHLQTVLAQLGFFSATPNGSYGKLTIAAVKKFQAAHGLTTLGVVGPATRAALNALGTGTTTPAAPAPSAGGNGYEFKNFMGLGEDSTDGPDVAELQKRLAALGFYSGEATGNFVRATESAVKKFQKAHGIPATGYVGSATRAALNQ